MAGQFLRIQPVGKEAIGQGRLALHVRGKTRHEYTRAYAPYAGRPPVSLVGDWDSVASILLEADRESRKGKPGRKGKGLADVLLTGPPRYDSEEAELFWTYELELEWAEAAIEWIISRLPEGSFVAHAELHRDEASPHIHAVIVPWNPHTSRMDLPRARAGLAGREITHPTKRVTKKVFVAQARETLDSYHEVVSSKFGIDRGVRGSVRGSWAVDKRVTMELDEKGSREKAERATRRAQAKEREAVKALKVWSSALEKAEERKSDAEQAADDAEAELKAKRKEVARLQGDYLANVTQEADAKARVEAAEKEAERRKRVAEEAAVLFEHECRVRRGHAGERAEMVAVVRQARKHLTKPYADLIRSSMDQALIRLEMPPLKDEEILETAGEPGWER